jgi:hypothetical protein
MTRINDSEHHPDTGHGKTHPDTGHGKTHPDTGHGKTHPAALMILQRIDRTDTGRTQDGHRTDIGIYMYIYIYIYTPTMLWAARPEHASLCARAIGQLGCGPGWSHRLIPKSAISRPVRAHIRVSSDRALRPRCPRRCRMRALGPARRRSRSRSSSTRPPWCRSERWYRGLPFQSPAGRPAAATPPPPAASESGGYPDPPAPPCVRTVFAAISAVSAKKPADGDLSDVLRVGMKRAAAAIPRSEFEIHSCSTKHNLSEAATDE